MPHLPELIQIVVTRSIYNLEENRVSLILSDRSVANRPFTQIFQVTLCSQGVVPCSKQLFFCSLLLSDLQFTFGRFYLQQEILDIGAVVGTWRWTANSKTPTKRYESILAKALQK